MIVTENGIATDDDGLRGEYLERHLAVLGEAIEAGVDVRGYLHWSLIDNFEWALGPTARFGLAAVDGTTQARALKPSHSDVAALTDHVYLHRTATTVRHAVGQIQRIVGALKSYSHLDQQATRIEADLHEGIETTLVLLHHTLRDIVVERRYGVLPRVPVFVDELNQVWTNIIDNAIDALNGQGELAIRTYEEKQCVIVEMEDNGPGIPEDIQPRIFDPFFTTKPPGQGTGLGLHISHDIIVNRHRGQITVESRPGKTKFKVMLPGTVNKA